MATEYTLKIHDTFTGTNGASINARTPDTLNTPGNTWTTINGTVEIQGNACAFSANQAHAIIDTGNKDHKVECTFNAGGADNRFSMMYRGNSSGSVGAGSYYNLMNLRPADGTGSVKVQKVVNGTFTDLAFYQSLGLNTSTTYTCTAIQRGQSQLHYLNGSLLGGVYDHNNDGNGTHVGLYHNIRADGSARVDDLKAWSVDRTVTDFSEYPSGQNLQTADWENWWDGWGGTQLVQTGASDIGGKHAELISTSNSRKLLRWHAIDETTDGELRVKCKAVDNFTSVPVRTYFRANEGGVEDGYFIALDGTNLTLQKYDTASGSVVQNATFSASTGTWYWVVVRFQGSALKAKAWADGNAEPGTWAIDTTDTTHTTGAIGLGSYSNSQEYHYDYFEFAKGTLATQGPDSGAIECSGTPTATTATSTSAAVRKALATGVVAALIAGASATAQHGMIAAGAVSAAQHTASGVSVLVRTGAGSPVANVHSISAAVDKIILSAGAVSAAQHTGTGAIEKIIIAQNDVVASNATATSAAVRVALSSGSVVADTATATGVAGDLTAKEATGSVVAGAAVCNSAALIIRQAQGAPSAVVATTLSSALRVAFASGISAAQIATSTGVAAVGTAQQAFGAASASPATTSATAVRVVLADSTATAQAAAATGSANIVFDAVAAVSASAAAVSAQVEKVIFAIGAVSVQAATATGVGAKIYSAAGAVNAQTATATGVGAVGAYVPDPPDQATSTFDVIERGKSFTVIDQRSFEKWV